MNSYPVDWYHQVPQNVKEILTRLHKEGFTAYIVGGAVRDLWMGLQPQDFDLVSNASPEQIQSLFPRTLDVGKTFGIIVVVTEEGKVEIARFRTDGAYTDGRHPSEVKFSNPAEDARRRDFTVNALFYDSAKGEVLDYVGGVEDLRACKLRTVGDPAQRFEEDALRMLRAVRFLCQLSQRKFILDPSILPAIRVLSERIKLVSRERITQEMEKILLSPDPGLGLRAIIDAGLWEGIFSCAIPSLQFVVGPAPIFLSLAAIKKEVPDFKPEEMMILSKENKQAIQKILMICEGLDFYAEKSIAEKKILLADPLFESAWVLSGQVPAVMEEKNVWEKSGQLNPPALLTGKDLLDAGIPPSSRIKTLLEDVRKAQLEEKIASKEEAMRLVHSLNTGIK